MHANSSSGRHFDRHQKEYHTTDNPTAAHRPAAPTAYSAVDAQPARVPARRSNETKAAFKTTEFIVYVVAVIGVLIASFLVSTTDAHEDYFRADRAWFYVAILEHRLHGEPRPGEVR